MRPLKFEKLKTSAVSQPVRFPPSCGLLTQKSNGEIDWASPLLLSSTPAATLTRVACRSPVAGAIRSVQPAHPRDC